MNENITMFYNAKPHIFEKAKFLRKNMTNAEKKIWNNLKGKKMLNLRFRPQHPIDIFIADFYCHPIKLVVEVDGSIHDEKEQHEYDIGRNNELNALGIKVVRVANEQITNNMNQVLIYIKKICTQRITEMKKSPSGDLGV